MMEGDDAPLERFRQEMQKQIEDLRRELQELTQRIEGWGADGQRG
jgi:cytochrome c-type biogenesis protein CcmH/NrfG